MRNDLEEEFESEVMPNAPNRTPSIMRQERFRKDVNSMTRNGFIVGAGVLVCIPNAVLVRYTSRTRFATPSPNAIIFVRN